MGVGQRPHLVLARLPASPAPTWWTRCCRGRAARSSRAAASRRSGSRSRWRSWRRSRSLNPFGWQPLAQPFDYVLWWSKEPIYRTIGELQPFVWSYQWRTLSPLLLLGWPLLVALRGLWLGRWDRVELLLCAALTPLPLSGQRFIGFFAVVAGPFVARAACEVVARLRERRAPAPALRPALLVLGLALLPATVFVEPTWRPSLRFEQREWPVAACDFMAREGVRGRGLTPFWMAGYQLWRFWPERDRLPFMDIHQSGPRELQDAYTFAFTDRGWLRQLDQRYRFDYAMLTRRQESADSLLSFFDRDTTWSLVFVDDVAALYVRRAGPLAAVAERDGYRVLPASRSMIASRGLLAQRDSVLRAALLTEARRAMASAPRSSRAMSLAATLELLGGHWDEGVRLLHRVLELDPGFPRVHERLGQVARERGDLPVALREFALERGLGRELPGVWFQEGITWMRAGRPDRAARAFREELRRFPDDSAARDSLAAAEAAR